ncbi:acyl-CoA/acyl-ACP dehydrogenase [Pelagibacterales bacterium]|jgi:(2S)-methylsuccinyl-CoA dehydrogenase|nr:acyl-CoA/acyl-ACP dehydrogenase [Pelagibacterales bacterium]MDA9980956.1 acyl-CoA/acyl-ACP dehydrogenase [Pelagibacterales bacterium]MDB9818041.1 acyl-CoA/acyl-ACP dehydrogenase [Pelagibacterales bacterium]MDB9985340.1 acyl-CoA/acyl-ACP dehydrogenase [Pelagibacterales bacterium]|tara:strand:- start:8927 stop:10573 length:1647 start_codon:yes stop_codon:yes gene_type:complete
MDNLLIKCRESLQSVNKYTDAAKQQVKKLVMEDGSVSKQLMAREQHAAHSLAWIATYKATLTELLNWAERLESENNFQETEQLILQFAFSEYLSQLWHGIPMSQLEYARPQDLGLKNGLLTELSTNSVRDLMLNGNEAADRVKLADILQNNFSSKNFGNLGLDDTSSMIIQEFKKFVEEDVVPYAHEWHLKDELIPMEVINKMAELGIFGLTIPEEYGGLGMNKLSMCVVTEELARGYIGIGSLGTRTDISSELLLIGGTEEQKKKWLPKIASGEILPAAVFSEPNTGSDLASLRTRAVKNGDDYSITGNKTWITHGARSDLMTLLARSNPDEKGYKGLSMFLAEKERGDDDNMFPSEGMSGGEIEVLGYRGMKEYEIAFDEFKVKGENLLGGEEGKGFKQLMETFESARIQTAARAVGVAQSAMETGMQYALDRNQFGKSIYEFPRVSSKVTSMVTEIMAARQLTYFSAREKDKGNRCDLEAGMAKLLGARVAWATSDNSLQIHGGNGFALEYPISRLLCDSRILNIFEGAAEMQADVIARRLLTSN